MKCSDEGKCSVDSKKDDGLRCPDCGCMHLPVWYTRKRPDRIVRKRICRHCGRHVVTYERIG